MQPYFAKLLFTATMWSLFILKSSMVFSQGQTLPSLQEVDVKASITFDIPRESYFYEYAIKNGKNSKGRILDFEIDITSSSSKITFDTNGLVFKNTYTKNAFHRIYPLVKKDIIVVGFPNFPDYEDANLSIDGMAAFSVSLVEPGQHQKGFVLMSKGLPGLREFVVHPKYDPTDYYPTVEEMESLEQMKHIDSLIARDRKELPFNGVTVGPVAPPKNFVAGDFVNTLSSYLNQSCTEFGWITNQGICRSLVAKLENVQLQLDRGNTGTAAGSLEAFINEVEAQKDKQLSSEAYALLYFNGQYLLERLE